MYPIGHLMLLDLAPRRVYLAIPVTRHAGGLLPTPFHPSPVARD